MKTRTIFVDCHVFDGSFQGSTSYLRGLYTELIRENNFFFYFASNDPTYLETIFGTHQNVAYLKYRFKNKFLRLLVDIPWLIKKYHVDYAHFQYIVAPIKLCKYIVTTHDVMFLDYPEYFPWSFRMKNGILFKWSAKKSEIVLTVSDYSKNRIQHHYQLKNITITHNAVDENFFRPYTKSEAQADIESRFGIRNFTLFVSRIEPRKNHLTLLKVFVEHKHYLNRELVFIGNDALPCPALYDYYNQLVPEIKSKIKILNRVNFADLVCFTQAAELSVYPSIAEGFGIPPLESLAACTPTICSNTTAMGDFDFISEFLFHPLDTEDFNKKIHLALGHTDWKSNKIQMMKKYNWKNAAVAFQNAIAALES